MIQLHTPFHTDNVASYRWPCLLSGALISERQLHPVNCSWPLLHLVVWHGATLLAKFLAHNLDRSFHKVQCNPLPHHNHPAPTPPPIHPPLICAIIILKNSYYWCVNIECMQVMSQCNVW